LGDVRVFLSDFMFIGLAVDVSSTQQAATCLNCARDGGWKLQNFDIGEQQSEYIYDRPKI